MRKINHKIPGVLSPPPKSEIDGKITDLSSKPLLELMELRDRQLKLINNKYFIQKLADKGSKIKSFLDKINLELKAREDETITCLMFKDLKINGIDKESVQNVEWEGQMKAKNVQYLDSDDDSDPEDIINIISQSTTQEKTIKVLPPETLLVTPQDLLEIGDVPHVRYIVNKTETIPSNLKEPFKPYKTTISGAHDPAKEVRRKRNTHWEVTAATPPPILHEPAKILTIEESLKLQKQYNLHLKEIEAKHAAEKLAARIGVTMAELPDDQRNFSEYRNVADESQSDPEGSDKEVYDEEPERGGIVVTVLK